MRVFLSFRQWFIFNFFGGVGRRGGDSKIIFIETCIERCEGREKEKYMFKREHFSIVEKLIKIHRDKQVTGPRKNMDLKSKQQWVMFKNTEVCVFTTKYKTEGPDPGRGQ